MNPRIQEYISQAERYGKRKNQTEFMLNIIQQGWQMGMQTRQMQAQQQALKQEKDKEALNAQFDVFKLRMPYMSDEQIDIETRKLLDATAKTYGISIDTSSMEFGGQEKKLANEAIKINEAIRTRKIRTPMEINAAYAKLRQDFPRRKLAAIEKEEQRSAGLLSDMQQRNKAIMDTIAGGKFKPMGTGQPQPGQGVPAQTPLLGGQLGATAKPPVPTGQPPTAGLLGGQTGAPTGRTFPYQGLDWEQIPTKEKETAYDKFKEWKDARGKAGLSTTKKDIEGYFRKGGKEASQTYQEWIAAFKKLLGREPTTEEIRQKLMSDPWGLYGPTMSTQGSSVPERPPITNFYFK